MTDHIGEATNAAQNAATAGNREEFVRMNTETQLATAHALIAIAERLERIAEQFDAVRGGDGNCIDVAVLR